MSIVEKKMNLFHAPNNYYYAHCVSADFELGAGVAKQMDTWFNLKPVLKALYGDYFEKYSNCEEESVSILVDNVFNLVTKKRYYDKPSYVSLTRALKEMTERCVKEGIKKVAMPKLGCGLDQLKWNEVKPIIESTLCAAGIDVLVCVLEEKRKQ